MTVSTRLALLTFVFGFAIEGATEAYQFFSYGYLHQAWVGFYYIGLGTTGAGFYLIYRGRHEWTDVHHQRVRQGHRLLWASVVLFVAATGAIAVLGTVVGGSGGGGSPVWVGWLVGGLVALAFGNFFLSLVLIISRLVSRVGRLLSWTAFGWSLGVAVLTGSIIGNEFSTLLHQFFTNPLGLIVSFAPLAFAMAPLFVTYFLFVGAYWDAHRQLIKRTRARYPTGAKALTGSAPEAARLLRVGAPPPRDLFTSLRPPSLQDRQGSSRPALTRSRTSLQRRMRIRSDDCP